MTIYHYYFDSYLSIPTVEDQSYSGTPSDCGLRYAKISSSRKYYFFFEKLTSIAFTGKKIFAPSFSFYRINFDFQVEVTNYVIITAAGCYDALWEVISFNEC